jgi:glycine dehydrogenase subunit 1
MEFVIESDLPTDKIDRAVREAGIIGGLPLDAHRMLYCATEMNTIGEINALIRALEGIV